MSTSEPFNAKSFWSAQKGRATGVAVVTARGPEGPAGFLALSATHLSSSPPTMMVSVGMKTSALSTILEMRHFAINYLPMQRRQLIDVFSGSTGQSGADRFVASDWKTLKTGAPILTDAVGALDCELVEAIERYDTVIAIGRLVAYTFSEADRPIVNFGGQYISLA